IHDSSSVSSDDVPCVVGRKSTDAEPLWSQMVTVRCIHGLLGGSSVPGSGAGMPEASAGGVDDVGDEVVDRHREGPGQPPPQPDGRRIVEVQMSDVPGDVGVLGEDEVPADAEGAVVVAAADQNRSVGAVLEILPAGD